MTSACDLNNPIYARSTPSVRYNQESLTDYIVDENDRKHVIKIDYEYYEYDQAVRLVTLSVVTKCPAKYLEEDVLEIIHKHERCRVVSECTMIINK